MNKIQLHEDGAELPPVDEPEVGLYRLARAGCENCRGRGYTATDVTRKVSPRKIWTVRSLTLCPCVPISSTDQAMQLLNEIRAKEARNR